MKRLRDSEPVILSNVAPIGAFKIIEFHWIIQQNTHFLLFIKNWNPLTMYFLGWIWKCSKQTHVRCRNTLSLYWFESPWSKSWYVFPTYLHTTTQRFARIAYENLIRREIFIGFSFGVVLYGWFTAIPSRKYNFSYLTEKRKTYYNLWYKRQINWIHPQIP